MADSVESFCELEHGVVIPDVGLAEVEAWMVFEFFDVGVVAVGQIVDHAHAGDAWIVEECFGKIATDEAGSTGNNDILSCHVLMRGGYSILAVLLSASSFFYTETQRRRGPQR